MSCATDGNTLLSFFGRKMRKSFWSVGGTLRKALPLSYTRLGKVTLHHENRIAQFCQSSAKMNWSGILELEILDWEFREFREFREFFFFTVGNVT